MSDDMTLDRHDSMARHLLKSRQLEAMTREADKGSITLGENTWRTIIDLDKQGHVEMLGGELRYWRIDDGERFWVKAVSRTDAVILYARECGPDWIEDSGCAPPEVVEVDPSETIDITDDDGPELVPWSPPT